MVLLLVLLFVYKKLNSKDNIQAFQALIERLRPSIIGATIGVLFIMMLVNWLLECAKWKYLCKPIESISFYTAIKSVFCGLSWAIFTPNRIGEYGGRVLFLSPRKRVFGILAMAVGALAQLVITNVMGSIALLWFLRTYQQISTPWFILGCVVVTLFIGILVMLYFRIHLLNKVIHKWNWLGKVRRFFILLERYQSRQLAYIFRLSMLRFLVFTSQYVLIMFVLLPDLPLVPTVWLIFLLFFIQSAMPSLDLLDVGVRSLTASYLFGFITTQELAVMASTASIWFINLIIPALIGAVFVFKINFFDNSNH